jgi:enterochelin esterase-like enzyme
MGASLGALAMLHTRCRHPDAFDGLFLQSGSYFQPSLDPQESGFRYWDRITRFVGTVLAAGPAARPLPISMTCGADEENLANNQELAAALLGQGYPVTFLVRPGGHDYRTWRASLHPPLTDLLAGS